MLTNNVCSSGSCYCHHSQKMATQTSAHLNCRQEENPMKPEIQGSGHCPWCCHSYLGEGKGYPLQCSGLENSMDCIVHGVAKSRIRLSDFHSPFNSHEMFGPGMLLSNIWCLDCSPAKNRSAEIQICPILSFISHMRNVIGKK